MNTRVRNKEQTRSRLLNAGLEVADREGLKAMTVDSVIAEAQSSKGAFFHHFAGRPEYLVALHRRFHDQVVSALSASVSGLEPGRDLLIAAANAYLDACLKSRGARGLLFEARSEPAIKAEIEIRNEEIASLAAPSFKALDIRDPKIAARLFIAGVVEAASLEHSAGHKLAAVRRAVGVSVPGDAVTH